MHELLKTFLSFMYFFFHQAYFSINIFFILLLFFFSDNSRRLFTFPLKYVCPRNCGRSYNHRATMNRHLKYECGVPPRFKCNVCGKMFAQKVNLNTHLISVHKSSTNPSCFESNLH